MRDPRWLFLSHSLPTALIIAVYVSAYGLVGTMLDGKTKDLWITSGITLLALHTCFFLAGSVLLKKRAQVPVLVAIVSLLIHSSISVAVFFNLQAIIPRSIPQWMFPPELLRLSLGLPLIPGIHALLMLAHASIRRSGSVWFSVMMTFTVPAAWYACFQLLIDSGRYYENGLIAIGTIALLSFLFFLTRTILQISQRTARHWSPHQLTWRIPIALVFPLLGLFLHAFQFSEMNGQGPFGDLSHPAFFIIAALNGILVCLPSPADVRQRLWLFFLRGIGSSYVLYFAIIFLPYLPFSIILVLFFGVGLLMLAPLALLVLQASDISRDAAWLSMKGIGSKKWGYFTAGFLAIPLSLVVIFQRDAHVMEKALTHVYAPHPAEVGTSPDASSVERVTNAARRHKVRSNDEFFFVNGIPLISGLYDRIVFKGLSVSDHKLSILEEVFLGDAKPGEQRRSFFTSTFRPPTGTVVLDDITTRTSWNDRTQTWSTWVDLSLTNGEQIQAEYATTFELPPGAYIRDHYLMIGDRRAEGILAERKAASWIYRQITTITRQDPSLLRYIGPDRLEFRVFPFNRNENRKTGFEIMTKEPFLLELDDRTAMIGSDGPKDPVIATSNDGRGLYISSAAKSTLPSVKPEPIVWFIIDRSARSSTSTDQLIARVERTLRSPELANAEVRFLISNAITKPIDKDHWRTEIKNTKSEGGLLLDHAMDHVLLEHRKNRASYPVVLIATDHADDIIHTERMGYAMAALGLEPEWFVLSVDGNLYRSTLDEGQEYIAMDLKDLVGRTMRAWPDAGNIKALLPEDGMGSMVILNDPVTVDKASGPWQDAIDLNTAFNLNALEPFRTLTDEHADAKASLAARVLSPATAFICLETEAQEIALMRKQEEILNGSSLMDAGEELQSMSEPGDVFLVMVVLILIGSSWYRYRTQRCYPR